MTEQAATKHLHRCLDYC